MPRWPPGPGPPPTPAAPAPRLPAAGPARPRPGSVVLSWFPLPGRARPAAFSESRVYLRSQTCWDIRPKAPDARRMSAALLHGMQANATRQMGLLGRIEQRWGVFRYSLVL